MNEDRMRLDVVIKGKSGVRVVKIKGIADNAKK